MRSCSLAVDIGASSGTVIAGYLQSEKMVIDEVYRFENRLIQKNGYFCWDIDKLWIEVKKGIHLTKKKGLMPVSIGVDTWAVDFVLLDENDELLMDAVSYRDPRTDGVMDEVFSIISKELLYLETGIQFQKFNSIYQLYYIKKKYPELLEKAKTFLMIPDYVHYLLTGVKVNEYTNATTTQLINAFTKKWDRDLLKKLDINDRMFQQVLLPKEFIGRLRPTLVEEFGFDMEVILPATHDTASAVLAVPETDETIFISSGTWSLMGVENRFPICITKALDYNFTNEGGFDYRYRFLKNIMGLWMIQEVKRNYKDQYSFADFSDMAENEKGFYSIVDVDDNRFLKPNNMIKEIQLYCKETGQPEPFTPGQVAKCVFDSLAISYKNTIEQIEEIYERKFNQINIIGGGSKNNLLNQLISDITEKKVIAGPSEATAIGNIISQLIALEQIEDIHQARNIIKNSFVLKTFRKRGGG